MPCLRHKSLVWAPASDSARMAMICSSVNLLFLMTPPSRRSPIITGSGSGGQVSACTRRTTNGSLFLAGFASVRLQLDGLRGRRTPNWFRPRPSNHHHVFGFHLLLLLECI